MILYWTICGADAARFPSHLYRVPLIRRLRFLDAHEPRRLDPMESYPNWGGPPCPPVLRTEDRVNVSAEWSSIDRATNTRRVTGYLEPSRYSRSKKRQPVFEMVLGGSLLWDRKGAESLVQAEFTRAR